MSEVVAFRTENGRFAPGSSGNPAGRPKGSRNRTTLLTEALSEQQQEALVQKLVEDALAGDRVLLRFCVERIPGKPAQRTITLDLAPGKENDPEAILAAAMRALADGEISPDEAVRIARAANAIGRVRLAGVQAEYVAAGIELRRLKSGKRVLRTRGAIPAAATRRDAAAPDARGNATPANTLFPGDGPAATGAGDGRAGSAARRVSPRLPAFGLFSPPSGRAALLGSVSPLSLVKAQPPAIRLYPASAPPAGIERLAA